MQVICLEEAAFYALIEQVVDRMKEAYGQHKDKWLSDEQTMHLLNIKSAHTKFIQLVNKQLTDNYK